MEFKNIVIKNNCWKKATKIIMYIFVALILFYFILSIFFPRKIMAIFKSQSFVIITNSMVPADLNVGDLVVVGATNYDELEKGDIISFYVDADSDGKDDVVTHFFERLEIIDGKTYIRTKSAVSDKVDGWYVETGDLVGKYKYQVPRVGKIVMYLRSPIGLITLVIDFIIIYLLISILEDEKKKEVARKLKLENDVRANFFEKQD